jgi:hypothetical protein
MGAVEEVLALETTRPTLELISFSLAETTILPPSTDAENFQSESRPGASSISPEQTLKQAGESAMGYV